MKIDRIAFVKGLLGLLMVLQFAGCVNSPDGFQQSETRVDGLALQGSDWSVIALDGIDAIAEPVPWLRWTGQDHVGGSGGCNNFAGKFVMEGERVVIGPLAATRMLCVPVPQGQEDKFFKAIENSRTLRLQGNELRLMDFNGKLLVHLRRPHR